MNKREKKFLKAQKIIMEKVVSGHLAMMYNEPKDMNDNVRYLLSVVRQVVEFPFKEDKLKEGNYEFKECFKHCKSSEFVEVFETQFNRKFLDSVAKYHEQQKIKRYKESNKNYTKNDIEKIKNSKQFDLSEAKEHNNTNVNDN